MSWFSSFVKSIGKKIASAGKVVLGKGKDLLKTGVSIGNKVLNNPISKRVIDLATPFLGATPVGRGVLLGVKGLQKGLEVSEKLLGGIETAERVGKTIQKVREGDLSANILTSLANEVKSGLDTAKEIKYGLQNFR